MPKISQLSTISHLTTSSILPVVDNNETQKVTLQRVVEFVSASLEPTFATDIELLRSASAITSSLNTFASASVLSVATKLSTSSFEAYTASVQNVNTSSLLLSSSFNTFTSSYKTDSASFDSRVDSLELINVSPFLSSSTFNTYTSSNNTTNTTQNSRLTSLENNSGSYLLKTETGSFILSSQTSSFITEAETGSFLTSLPNNLISGSTQISNLGFATTSSVLNIDTSSLVTTSSFNTFTSSYKSGSFTGSFSGSFVGNVTGTANNANYSAYVLTQNLNTNGEYSLVFTPSGSNGYLQTYTDGGSNLLYNPSTNRLRADYFSGSIQATNGVISGSSQITSLGFISSSTDVTPFLSASTFNSYTSSTNANITNLIAYDNLFTQWTTIQFNPSFTASFYSSSILLISASSLSNSSSLFVNRLNQIESVSGSWITESETSSFALTANLPVVTPFLSSSTFNTFTASINTFTSSANTSLSNVYSATSSLNTFTSSINTTIKSKLNTDGVISGSSQISGLGYATTSSVANVDTSSLLLTSSFNTYTASLLGAISSSTQITNLGFATTSSLAVVTPFLSSSVFNTFATSSNTFTASVNTTTASLNTFTSSYGTTSASFDSRINSIVNGSGFATTSSFNAFTASVNTTTASLNGKTGSYATTGSNVFVGNQVITGSLILSSSAAVELTIIGNQTISGSLIQSGSLNTIGPNQFNGNTSITGSLTVNSGTIISSSLNANSSSLYLTSGSNLYIQNNGYVEITGSVTLSGSMTIQSGSITMPNRPAFRVYGAGSTNIAAVTGLSGSLTTIDYNEGGYYSNTNGKFTAPLAGLYQVYFNGRVGNVNSQMQVIVYKNTNIVQLMWETSTNTGATHFGVSGIFKLAANDTLEAKVAVGTIQFDGNDSWGATYIG